MINSYNLNRLHTLDFAQVMANMEKHFSGADLNALQLKPFHDTFKESRNAFEQALIPFRNTGLTSALLDLDTKRDNALVGLSAHVNAYLSFPEADKAKAAQIIRALMDKYGKQPQRLPLREETSMIRNLIEDLEAPQNMKMVELMDAKSWVKDLFHYNSEFETLYNDRTRQEAAIETGKTRQTRIALQEAFTKMVKAINSLAFINGEEPYKTIADNINREVEQAKIMYKNNKTEEKE